MFILKEYKVRPFAEEDVERDLEWRKSIRFLAASCSGKIASLDDHRKWFASVVASANARYLILEHRGLPIGVFHFSEIDSKNGRASWGLYLSDKAQAPGTGTVLGFCGIDYALSVLGLRKIAAQIISSNAKSLALHRRLGFVQEGHLYQHFLKDGFYQDMVILALFANQWASSQRAKVGSFLFSDWHTGIGQPVQGTATFCFR
jgi:UDP-4-amino-4,6-dideoxy-N-acetyl-beta-L-altrosamine N-acetyltransferase